MPPPSVARLKGIASRVVRATAREWVVLLGMGSLVSLAFLWPYVPTPGHWYEKDKATLDLVDWLLRNNRAAEARELAEAFAFSRTSSREVGRAYHLAGLATAEMAQQDPKNPAFPDEAIEFFRAAGDHGFSPALIVSAYRRVAALHASHRRYALADDVYERLFDRLPDLEDFLRRAWVVARAARMPGAPATLTVERALAYVAEYEKGVGKEKAARAAATRAGILALHGRLDEAMTVMDDAFIAWPSGDHLWQFHFERGKIHRRFAEQGVERLYHYEEAQRDFEEAARLAPTPTDRATARYFEGDAFRALRSKQAEARLLPIIDGNVRELAALANLAMGRYRQETGIGDPLGHFADGTAQVEGPGVFDRYDFDVAEFFEGGLQPQALSESEPARLATVAQTLVQLRRLFPFEARYRELRESALVRAARALKDRADGVRESGDLKQADNLERQVADHFRAASAEWLELAHFPGVDSEGFAVRSLRAAHRLAEGRLFIEAAALYRAFYDVNPKKHAEGAYFEALCLHRAGLLVGREGRSGAREALERFRRDLPPSDPLAAYVTIELGRVLTALGEYADALAVLRQVTGLESPVSPVTPDDFFRIHGEAHDFRIQVLGADPTAHRMLWGAALLEIGRAALFRSRELTGDARQGSRHEAEDALLDFQRRYPADAASTPPDTLEVDYTLGQLYREGGLDQKAEEALGRAIAVGGKPGYPLSSDEAVHLRTAHYMLGDLAMARGDFTGAQEVYRRAFRRFDAHPDSVWAKVGLAEAARGLGKDAEARDHLEGARRHFEEHSGSGELGPEEFAYWKDKLKE